MTATILRGNALDLPLADASVDLVVTSPPYFGMRSYTDGGQHYAGQLGSEATPAEFVDALLAATAEAVRVLKPSGSLWVNLGDKYSGAQGQTTGASSARHSTPDMWARTDPKRIGIPNKSLCGIPWRYALRCIDDLGLILRAEVIWSKPNGLPESVTDRVRRSHEQWFHFTRAPRYFAAVDAIREDHARAWGGRPNGGGYYGEQLAPGAKDANLPQCQPNALGKLPGSVWSIATQPLKVPDRLGVDHFAAFPMEWPRRIVRGWSPSGICTECGEGRRPVVVSQRTVDGEPVEGLGGRKIGGYQTEAAGIGNWRFGTDRTITGESCACPEPTAPTRPAVVLDPFGGTGTTALVAHALGRHGISVDMSADYCRLAEWRTTDPGELARALQVDRPDPVDPAQPDLLALLAED